MGRALLLALNNAAAIVLVVFGILLIPSQMQDWLRLDWVGRFVTWLLVLTFGASALFHLVPTRIQRRFGLSRYRARGIVLRKTETVDIEASGEAVTETEKVLVFLATPEPEDLVDFIELPSGLDLSEKDYSSPDSTIADVRKRTRGFLAIFWQPKDPIAPFAEYVHKTRILTPGVPGRQSYFNGAHVDRETGVIEFELRSARRIAKAAAIRWFGVLRPTRLRIYKRALSGSLRKCPQPTIDEGGLRATWKLEQPKFKSTYLCCLFFEDGQAQLMAEIDAARFRTRLKRAWFAALPRSWAHRLSLDSPGSRGA